MHRRAKWRNTLNSALILGGMTALLALCAWALFGPTGIIWAVGLGLFLSAMTPRLSPSMVLRFYKARPIHRSQAPELFQNLRVLAKRAELPAVPKLYYIPSSNMNAFAVGRPQDSAITFTDGILRGLTLRQLTAVLAHEISHIANEDLKVMGLADMVGRLTSTMQTVGFLTIFFGLWHGGNILLAAFVLMLAPTVGTYLQLALSRSREYDADLGAARLTGDPEGLASALRTLERKHGSLWENIFIPGGRNPDPSVLRTHPKTEDRIERLLALKGQKPTDRPREDRKIVLPSSFHRVMQPPHYHMSGFWF